MTSTAYDTVRPVIVGGLFAAVGANFTRPADANAYAVGDLIANSTTAGSVAPLTLAIAREADKSCMIRRLRLKVNDVAWLNAVIRAHLYRDTPTPANGDNGVWSTSESNYIGSADITLDKSFTDPFVKGIGVPAVGSEWNVDPSPGTVNIFALLEARTAVTPGSGKIFTLVAEVLRN